jgi:hypothetical protein
VNIRIVLLLAIAFAVDTQEQQTLVGRWRSLATSRGGIGATFMFYSEGTLELTTSVIVESKYRMEGDRLVTPGGSNGQDMVEVIELLSDKILRTRLTQTTDLQMTREGPIGDRNQPIVGSWKGNDQSAEEWEFFADGTVAVTSGARGVTATTKSRYNLSASDLRVEIEGGAMNGSLRADGDVPVLKITSTEMVRKAVREGSSPDPKNLLLGSWLWRNKNLPNGSVLSQYRTNGTMLMIMGIRTDRGHYTLRGDRIRLDIEGRPVAEGTFRWDGPVLIIPGPRGEGESRFERY